MWQIGLNLSSGIHCCLALASARQPWWCSLGLSTYRCVCVCVNGGPDLAWVREVWLLVLLLFVVAAKVKSWGLSNKGVWWDDGVMEHICSTTFCVFGGFAVDLVRPELWQPASRLSQFMSHIWPRREAKVWGKTLTCWRNDISTSWHNHFGYSSYELIFSDRNAFP